jgi:LPXTG-site transpeptidase (sortase) family protein
VAVTDANAPGCAKIIGALAVGANDTYNCTSPALTADMTNTADVTGDDPLGNPVTDDDTADVEVIGPSIDIQKTPDNQQITSGGTASFTITVTNTGETPLANVAVTDANAPGCAKNIGALAVGANDTYNCTSPALTADMTNTANVSGDDPLGNPVTDDDTADVEVLVPGIGSIGDYVWNDADGQGDQNEAAAGIQNVRVYIDQDSSNTYTAGEPNDLTDAAGAYTITGLAAGTYDVRVDMTTLPAGYSQTGDPNEVGACAVCDSYQQVVLAAGENYVGSDFGYQQQDASIGDLIWNDADGDGVKDGAESGINGVRVYIDSNNSGSYEGGELTAITNAVGAYTISDLPAGTYRVRVDTTSAALSGFGQTGDPDQPGIRCTTCDNEHIVTLTAGENYTAADFGYHDGPVTISKTIFATDPGNVAITTGNNVAIGEIIVYQLQADFAPGTYPASTITDTLNQGLAYVGCVQGDQSNGGLTITNFDDLCTNRVAVSRFPAASTSDVNDGRRVVFDLGDVENLSGGNQTLTLRYQVVVLNTTGNDRGDTLTNQAFYDLLTPTSAPPVTIVEPALGIRKTADTSVANPGDVITFRIEIFHTPISNAHAFDVIVRDSIPSDLIYVTGSLQPVPISPQNPQQPTTLNITGGTDIEVVWDQFLDDPDPTISATSAFTFQARMGAVAPGDSVVNTANVEWTSLLGDFRPAFSAPISPHNTTWSFERWYDPADLINLNTYGGISSSATVRPPCVGCEAGGRIFKLPGTGFAPGRVTHIPRQPLKKMYQSFGAVWLEIPSLSIQVPIAGIPLTDGGWDVSWLWNQAGYLEGTAFPTTKGNTVITSHVYLPNGSPGPFVDLSRLGWGDEIIIHAYGQQYIYHVRGRYTIRPYNLSVFEHKEEDWVTLLTCSSYNENTATYLKRLYIQAILVRVDPETP